MNKIDYMSGRFEYENLLLVRCQEERDNLKQENERLRISLASRDALIGKVAKALANTLRGEAVTGYQLLPLAVIVDILTKAKAAIG